MTTARFSTTKTTTNNAADRKAAVKQLTKEEIEALEKEMAQINYQGVKRTNVRPQ